MLARIGDFETSQTKGVGTPELFDENYKGMKSNNKVDVYAF